MWGTMLLPLVAVGHVKSKNMKQQQIIEILLELGFTPNLDIYTHTHHDGVVSNFSFIPEGSWGVDVGKEGSRFGWVDELTPDLLYHHLLATGFKTDANY